MSATKLSEIDKKFIRDNYLKYSDREIAELLNANIHNIIYFRKKEKLKIPIEITKQRSLKVSLGRIPHNKGKKITEYLTLEQIEKFKENTFKKGIKVHNRKPLGYITKPSSKKHLRIKVSMDNYPESNFEYLSHYIWKQHHGSIPEGKLVAFKNLNIDITNAKNYIISNFILIDKAENMSRISIQNSPEILKKISRLKGQLTKQIKKHEQSKL